MSRLKAYSPNLGELEGGVDSYGLAGFTPGLGFCLAKVERRCKFLIMPIYHYDVV